MRNKHFYTHAVFLIILLITAIPIMLFILMELFGYEEINVFFKDHGSLIAGLIGFVGIFLLISNQNKSTKKTVNATLSAIHLEAFEIKKRDYLNEIITIMTAIDETIPEKKNLTDNFHIEEIDDSIIKTLNKGFRYLRSQDINVLKKSQNYLSHFWSFFYTVYTQHFKIFPFLEKEGYDLIELKNLHDFKKGEVLKHLDESFHEIKTIYHHEPNLIKTFHKHNEEIKKMLKKEIWIIIAEDVNGNPIQRINPVYIRDISIFGLRACNLYLDLLVTQVRELKIEDDNILLDHKH